MEQALTVLMYAGAFALAAIGLRMLGRFAETVCFFCAR